MFHCQNQKPARYQTYVDIIRGICDKYLREVHSRSLCRRICVSIGALTAVTYFILEQE